MSTHLRLSEKFFLAAALIIVVVIFSFVHLQSTTAATPPSWDISTPDGSWDLDLILDSDGSHRYHTMTIDSFDRTTGVFGGTGDTTGTVPPPASILFHWDITSGSVEGNTVAWSLAYQEISVTASLTGTINNSTSMSGTWASGAVTGVWTATNGQATGLARLTVTKLLDPTNDSGLFNLLIDATSYATNVGNNGSTGQITVEAGARTVSETGGTGTNLGDYNSIIDQDCAADGSIALAAGDNKSCTITNMLRLGSISGMKWNDLDGDSLKDQGEPGLPNWEIILLPGNAATTTDVNGNYSFEGLEPGDYTISETLQTGWIQTKVPTNPISVAPGASVADQDFGNFKLGSISGKKFNDLNGNRVIDDGEPGIVNWEIRLSPGSQPVFTDANGNYSYLNLPHGFYIVSEVIPFGQGWEQTLPFQPDTYSIEITSGLNAIGKDFGNKLMNGSIIVHKDVVNPAGGEAADTTQFIVTLNAGNQQPLAEGTNATYANLVPGTYTIAETGPATHDLMTAVDLADADAQTEGHQVTVAPGQTVNVTITNRQHNGFVKVFKEIVGPDGDPDVEDPTVFTASVDTDPVNRQISENNPATFTVFPGFRTITELLNQNYELVSITPSSTVTVLPDQTINVTITNKPKVVTIRINKIVQDVNGIATTTDSHLFSVTVGNETKPLMQGTTTVVMLPAGTYTITESSDLGYDIVSTPLPVSLSAGQSITKTITNRQKRGNIVVHKDVIGPNGEDASDSTVFQVQLNGGGDTPISENATTTFDNLVPGSYTLTETTHAGYEAGTFSTTTPIVLDPGETVDVTVTNKQQNGKIIIEKQTDPSGDPQLFAFTGEIQTSLVDNGTEEKVIAPGQYTVSESIPAGWDLSSIVCDDSESQALSGGNLGNATATFNVEPGEIVRCVFNNIKRGTLTIVKEAVGGDASFTFKHPTSIDTFALGTANGRATTTFEFPANTAYDVTEQTPPVGWQQVGETLCQGTITAGGSVECRFVNKKKAVIEVKKTTVGGIGTFHFTGLNGSEGLDLTTTEQGQSVSSFFDVFVDVTGTQFILTEEVPAGWSVDQQNCLLTLLPGQETNNTCSFTNTKLGSITIVKDADPNDAQDFEFTGPRGAFTLDDDQDGVLSNSTTTNDLLPGTYSVTETVPSGWDLTSATCSDESDPNLINLSAGEQVTCTFTNTKRGTLTIVKNAIGGDDTFTFEHPTGTAAFALNTISGHATTTFEIPAGISYDVTEQFLAGWDLTSNPNCQGTLDPGENKICTFENTKRSKLQVRKTTIPSGDSQQFEIVISGTGTVFGSATGTITDIINYTYDLTAGTYDVVETLPDGWVQTDNTCHDKVVTAGSTAQNCTVTNTKKGRIVVHKNVIASDTSEVTDNTPFTVQLNGANDQQVAESATTTYENLVPGSYTLSELQNSDYATPSFSTTTPIVVNAGQTVDVTITNKQKPGSIFGMKWNDLNGDGVKDENEPGVSGWTIMLNPGNVATTTNASGNYSFEGLPAGTYTVAEVQNSDWDQTFPPNPGTYSVGIGPNVHVTGKNFGNRLRKGTIIIEKQTLPDGDPTQFTLTGHPAGLVGDGDTIFEDVEPGQYQSTETIPPLWKIESIACDDGASASPSNGDPQNGTVTFNVGPGENVRCVVTNKKVALITVKKTSIGGTDTFSFTGDLGPFDLITTQPDTPVSTISEVFLPVLGQTLTFTETVPPGWSVDQQSCILENVIPGENRTCEFVNTKLGSITIVKDAAPDDSQDFEFTGPRGTFFLDDDQDGVLSNSTTTNDLLPGTYSVTEVILAGWDLTSATCSDESDPSTINLSAGEQVTCTFTNTKRGKIVVDKVTDPAGDPQVFTFTPDWDDPFALTDADTPYESIPLVPGVYSVSETEIVRWDLVSSSCDDGSDPDAIQLDEGETVTCTFTNRKRPTLTVNKILINDNGGTALVGSFTLKIDGSQVTDGQTVELALGSHTVSEDPFSGYASVIGGDCALDGLVSLASGDAKVCTITNDDVAPHLTVKKHVVNNDGGTLTAANFNMIVGGTNVLPQNQFPGDEQGTTVTLDAGLVSVSEDLVPNYTSSFEGDCSGTIPLGALWTCTVTNDDQPGTLHVVKVIDNSNGGTATSTQFFFSINEGEPIRFEEDGQNDVTVDAGEYDIVEVDPLTGYSVSYQGCENVTIPNGGEATCTITNDDEQATITVKKVVMNDNGGNATTTDVTLFVDTTQVGNGDPLPVNPGSYTVSESPLPGYAATMSGDCDEDGAVTVALGEHKTCTITNDDMAPSVTLIKNIINNSGGTASPIDFDLILGGVEVQSGATTTVAANVPIEITELSLTGYSFVSITGDPACPTALGGAVTLNEDEHVTCTITNDDRPATITVEKIVMNDNGGTASTTDFMLFVDTTQVGNGDPLGVTPGTHVVSESGGPSGYSATFTGDCDAQGNVAVALNEHKTCTITNDDQASHLIVKKTTFPGGDPTEFSITASGTGTITGGGVGTVTDALDKNYEVTPGTYGVVEDPVAGWVEVYNTCSGVIIALGETKACEIVNKTGARLTVSKTTRGGVGTFHFTGIGNPGGFDLTTIQENTLVSSFFDVFVDVQGTPYTIQEDASAGWTQTPSNRTCTVTLKPGDQKTCSFVNEKNAGLTVVKHVIIDNGGTLVASSFTLHVKNAQGNEVAGSPAAGSETGTFYELAPGTYMVSENNQSGYSRIFSGDCDALGKVTLGPNEQKTCTVTNDDIPAKIKVVKIVVNDNGGTKQVVDFPLFIDGNPIVSGQVVSVLPGAHVISETSQPGYSGIFSGECDATGNMTVALGQTKVCFLTNNDEVIASISGIKFEDKNGNGVRDLGEPGLQGWRIYLDINHSNSRQTSEPSVLTVANGRYSFGPLAPGTYDVREVLQGGWKQSHPASGEHVVNVIAGQVVNGRNFGNYQQGKISGVKFNDLNNNGLKDLGELANGWVITLKRNGLVVGTPQTTAGGGKYQFINLDPGLYEVSETLKPGWSQMYPGGTGVHEVDLESGGNVIDRDFGNFKLGVIGGVKYNDVNGNGTRQVLSEPGLSGWTIHLVNTGNGQQYPSVTTGLGGVYSFGNLPAGTYTMWEQPQGPMVPTEPRGGVYQNLVISTSGQTLIKNFGNKNALPNLP